jgi:hypothetical protein
VIIPVDKDRIIQKRLGVIHIRHGSGFRWAYIGTEHVEMWISLKLAFSVISLQGLLAEFQNTVARGNVLLTVVRPYTTFRLFDRLILVFWVPEHKIDEKVHPGSNTMLSKDLHSFMILFGLGSDLIIGCFLGLRSFFPPFRNHL